MGNCETHEEADRSPLPLLEGELWKKEGGMFGHMATWEKHEFVLKRQSLHCFATASTTEDSVLTVNADCSLRTEEQGGAPTKHRWILEIPKGEPWSLCAETNHDMARWVSAIAKARRPRWRDDQDILSCERCQRGFSSFRRKHHCRNCGGIFCEDCAQEQRTLPLLGYSEPVRICRSCIVNEVKGQPSGACDGPVYPVYPGTEKNPDIAQAGNGQKEERSPLQPRAGNQQASRGSNQGGVTEASSHAQRLREKLAQHKENAKVGNRKWGQ